MTLDQILLFSLFGGVFAMLLWGKFRYDFVAFSALLVALVLGLVSTDQAFSGFGHPATVIVALVLVIFSGLQNSGTINLITLNINNTYSIRSARQYRFWRLAVVFAVSIFGTSSCVNESKQMSSGLQLPQNNIAIIQAKAKNLDYITVRWRRYQLVRQLQFETQSFGIIQLNPGFISDGSSSLIADDAGSRLAGFLHDALYRGSSYLEFPQGFPGRWSKSQADQEYCFQLERLGASKYRQNINCRGLKNLPAFLTTWEYHRLPREKYWKTHEISTDKTTHR